MEKVYNYCDRCGKPVENPSSDEDGILICKECALEIYQKIFGNGPRNIKEGSPPK